MLWLPSRKHFKYLTNLPYKKNKVSKVDYHLSVDGNTLVCAFQQSIDAKDWMDDFLFFPKKIELYKGSSIFVHRGVANQYLSMRNEFLDLCYRDDIRNIHIAGYSLGGGLAQLACQDAAWHFPNKEICSISYEGLRVFMFNKSVKRLMADKQFIIKSFWDIVTIWPPFWLGFTDYGMKKTIGKFFRILPNQHGPAAIENNLFEAYGE